MFVSMILRLKRCARLFIFAYLFFIFRWEVHKNHKKYMFHHFFFFCRSLDFEFFSWKVLTFWQALRRLWNKISSIFWRNQWESVCHCQMYAFCSIFQGTKTAEQWKMSVNRIFYLEHINFVAILKMRNSLFF